LTRRKKQCANSVAKSTDFAPELGWASTSFTMPSDARSGSAEPCVDNFLRLWLSLASPSEITQMACLDLEQAGFHGGGAPQPPQQTR
jgi:hypothetical protein